MSLFLLTDNSQGFLLWNSYGPLLLLTTANSQGLSSSLAMSFLIPFYLGFYTLVLFSQILPHPTQSAAVECCWPTLAFSNSSIAEIIQVPFLTVPLLAELFFVHCFPDLSCPALVPLNCQHLHLLVSRLPASEFTEQRLYLVSHNSLSPTAGVSKGFSPSFSLQLSSLTHCCTLLSLPHILNVLSISGYSHSPSPLSWHFFFLLFLLCSGQELSHCNLVMEMLQLNCLIIGLPVSMLLSRQWANVKESAFHFEHDTNLKRDI